MRKGKGIRNIKPEQICIGDIISSSVTIEGITTTSTGTVARREHIRPTLTAYYTKEGGVLFVWDRYEKRTVKLIWRDNTPNQLAGLERIE